MDHNHPADKTGPYSNPLFLKTQEEDETPHPS
jgi:hypothetical protein